MSRFSPALAATMTTAILAIVLTDMAIAADGAEPLIKQGTCPGGYPSQGSYCVPRSNARPAMPKSGSCPSGYLSNGAYCVAGKQAKPAMPKVGRGCPSGWLSNGDYCVRYRE